jgi:hypothetical protein
MNRNRARPFYTGFRTPPYVGRGDTLYITVKRAAVDVEAFSELNALHLRYGVDREQLKALDTGRFAKWFTD